MLASGKLNNMKTTINWGGELIEAKISLTRKASHIKNTWWEWECEAELPDGEILHGWILGDEYNVAGETFEVMD